MRGPYAKITGGEPFATYRNSYQRKSSTTPAAQTIQPTGIASAEAFGTAKLQLVVKPTGISSGQAFGATTLAQRLQPGGITSAEAFGAALIIHRVTVAAIASGAAFGAALIQLRVTATSVSSGESLGSPLLDLVVALAGITTGEAFGSPSVIDSSPKAIGPTAIDSAEAFGVPTVGEPVAPSVSIGALHARYPTVLKLPAKQTIHTNAIASIEIFGTPAVITRRDEAAVLLGAATDDASLLGIDIEENIAA